MTLTDAGLGALPLDVTLSRGADAVIMEGGALRLLGASIPHPSRSSERGMRPISATRAVRRWWST